MFQKLLNLVYPDHCMTCNALVDGHGNLCGSCWQATPFINGPVCHFCGVPLPGDDQSESDLICDSCMARPRPWQQGRAVMLYQENGRKLVLALKHGDHSELSHSLGNWLARAGAPLFQDNCLIVPVPLHWSRLVKRKYNQSALLARSLADHTGFANCNDALLRRKKTASLDHMSADQRFDMLTQAIEFNPKRRELISGRPIILVDDVMTSGATLTDCTRALQKAGARQISTLVLARVAKGF